MTIYRNPITRLSLSTLNAEQHGRTCGYWYAVEASGSTPHTAFRTRPALVAWLALVGLELSAEMPEEGVYSYQSLIGAYDTVMTFDRFAFWRLTGDRVRAMSNGQYTLGIVEADPVTGTRTVWTLNPNCAERPIYDYLESQRAEDAGDYAAPVTPAPLSPGEPVTTAWPRVTAAPYVYKFGPACGSYSVTVPEGVALKPVKGEPGTFWVDAFGWCDAMTRHDAEHYGIRVPLSATRPRGKVPTAARFEPSTRTIRSVPENYWLASSNSWDGAVDHDGTARLFARAPQVEAAAVALIEAFGGDVPDWLVPQVTALADAITTDR